MKTVLNALLIMLVFSSANFSQIQHTIMNYNLLNYPGNDTAVRNPYFQTTMASVVPDILVVQEMTSQAGVDGFLQNVLLPVSPNYAAGIFIDGPDTDNAIFYKSDAFTFISSHPIQTTLRDISEFILTENSSGDTIRIYSVHLKASTGSSNEQQRKNEVDSLRKVTDALPPGTHYMVVGDFNIYSSNEAAYSALLNQTNPGYFVDIYNLPGTWNNPAYASYHTQSPRLRQFGGGATGGLDDRFDLMLMSQSLIDPGGISYIDGSFTSYGNDGNHYNDSINRPPNTVVSQLIADALHYSSDHLPVFAQFQFNPQVTNTLSITALIEGFYHGVTMVPDTIITEIRNAASPYTLVDQTKILLDENGQGTGNLNNVVNAVPYYLVIKHQNAIETWSSVPQSFSSNSLVYDFTTLSGTAYGNNLKLVGTKWCIYGGDTNQDGFIDAGDLNQVFVDNVNGVTGYVETDLNGDTFTEIEDVSIVFINNVLGIYRKTPPGY